jgi:Na+-translocating ferredoxin:NAD+ oxidoreductase subunit B
MTVANQDEKMDRRKFLGDNVRIVGALGLCGLTGLIAVRKSRGENLVWQIDPDKCMACGHCEVNCVLDESAVKAVQCFTLCGYCDVCTGYFPTKDYVLETGAENQLCPTGAINRKFIEEKGGQRFFEYTIDESLCIACGKCVAGCKLMNGSLYLQVRHDRCLNCNECAIGISCPTQAFVRVPAGSPNLLKKIARDAEEGFRRNKKPGEGNNVEQKSFPKRAQNG